MSAAFHHEVPELTQLRRGSEACGEAHGRPALVFFLLYSLVSVFFNSAGSLKTDETASACTHDAGVRAWAPDVSTVAHYYLHFTILCRSE